MNTVWDSAESNLHRWGKRWPQLNSAQSWSLAGQPRVKIERCTGQRSVFQEYLVFSIYYARVAGRTLTTTTATTWVCWDPSWSRSVPLGWRRSGWATGRIFLTVLRRAKRTIQARPFYTSHCGKNCNNKNYFIQIYLTNFNRWVANEMKSFLFSLQIVLYTVNWTFCRFELCGI